MVAPFEGGARQRRRPSPERGPETSGIKGLPVAAPGRTRMPTAPRSARKRRPSLAARAAYSARTRATRRRAEGAAASSSASMTAAPATEAAHIGMNDPNASKTMPDMIVPSA